MSAIVIPFPVREASRASTAGAGPASISYLHPARQEVEISRSPELALFLGLYASLGAKQQEATRRTLSALAYGGDPSAVAAFKLLSGGL